MICLPARPAKPATLPRGGTLPTLLPRDGRNRPSVGPSGSRKKGGDPDARVKRSRLQAVVSAFGRSFEDLRTLSRRPRGLQRDRELGVQVGVESSCIFSSFLSWSDSAARRHRSKPRSNRSVSDGSWARARVACLVPRLVLAGRCRLVWSCRPKRRHAQRGSSCAPSEGDPAWLQSCIGSERGPVRHPSLRRVAVVLKPYRTSIRGSARGLPTHPNARG